MTKLAISLRRAFDRRYRIGLVLLACLATVTFALTFRLTQMETQRAEIVSIAANQRTLSQRIAFLANARVDAHNTARQAAIGKALLKNVRTMEEAHDTLTGRGEATGIDHFLAPLHDIYFAGTMPFDQQVAEFLADARIVADSRDEAATSAALTRLNAAGTNYIMQTHSLVTRVLESEAKRSIAAVERAEIVLWAATLILLVLEGIFIFRPMSRRIARSVDDVERAEARSAALARETQAANAARSRFFRAVSHELRTPLNAILGITTILRARDDFAAHEQEVGQLEIAGEHLLHLVNNMLEMNRLGRGNTALKETKSDLADDIRTLMDIYRPQMAQRGVAFEVDIADAIKGDFIYDRSRLRQVIANLIVIFGAHPAPGVIRVVINEGAISANDTDQAAIGFAITRTDLPEEAIDLDNPVSLQATGEGYETDMLFGLSIAANIVRRMGGAMEAHGDEAARGVRFTLPMKPAKPARQLPVTTRRKVLVVDDNVPNQMVACAFLASAGIETAVATDGREAVEKAGREKFDLILMDVSMPVMDGVEAARLVRAGNGPNAATPIVALTAHVQQEEIEGLLAAGMKEVLHKPVDKAILTQTVDHWTNGRKERATA